jgi:hypothetical protein
MRVVQKNIENLALTRYLCKQSDKNIKVNNKDNKDIKDNKDNKNTLYFMNIFIIFIIYVFDFELNI